MSPDPSFQRALREAVDALQASSPPRLGKAVEDAVFPGGARVRPSLCVAVARACALPTDLTYAAAVAVELLHCASLVHDDLPCFDDAPVRRGRPSIHARHGEATAVLVGDGLIVHAFETLGRAALASRSVEVLLTLSAAAGARGGLVAGQAWELESRVDVATYHRAKTAALFEAACALGALSVGERPRPFAVLGQSFGLAFQVLDDVADRIGDASALGKPTGLDERLGRPSAAAGGDSLPGLVERAVASVVAAVPPCAGEVDLRAFVGTAFERLVARAGLRAPRACA